MKQKTSVNIKGDQNYDRLDELKQYGVDEQSLLELKNILKAKSNPEEEKTVAKRIANWMGNLTNKAIEKGIELQIPQIMEKVQDFL